MSGSNARRMRTWAATTVAITGAVAMLANADTIYVDPNCGDDAWTGQNPDCIEPNGPKRTIDASLIPAGEGGTVILADGIYLENSGGLFRIPRFDDT